MQLDEDKQMLVAQYYKELYSEIPEEWWDLEGSSTNGIMMILKKNYNYLTRRRGVQ